jgi:hypothetical protein
LLNEDIKDILTNHDENLDEIEKRKPKPFRYISIEDIKDDEIDVNENYDFSVMKNDINKNDLQSKNNLVFGNLQNIEKIEEVINKHTKLK